MPSTLRLTIIYNPIAGRRRQGFLEDVTDRLAARGWTITLKATAARGDAETFAREIAHQPSEQRPDLLAVAGGDGTIGEAINGLVQTEIAAPMPFGIIPMGTANVLAAEIGLDVTAEAVAAALDARHARSIFVGLANGRAFTLMVGAGFDAQVVSLVDPALKRRFGKGAYVWQSLCQLRRFSFPAYRVTVDDGEAIEVASVIVAKGHYYGGRHVVAPQARLDKPSFEICLFERRGAWQALCYAMALGLGRLPRMAGFRIVTGTGVTIAGPAGDVVQGDGDIIGHLPISITIAPTPLSLVMPRS